MAVDIVCGKAVDESAINLETRDGSVSQETPASTATKRFYCGKWYFFCSLVCRQKFVATPDEYIAQS